MPGLNRILSKLDTLYISPKVKGIPAIEPQEKKLEYTSADALDIVRLERYTYQHYLEIWYQQMPEVYRISAVPKHTSADVLDIT